MGLLDNFERGLERVVNGAFAKTFRSGLQPVEVSAALRRELDTKAAVVSRERILVPNSFLVSLSPADYDRFHGIGPTLIADFVRIVDTHAREQGFQFAGPVTVALQREESLTDGLLQVTSSNVDGSAIAWTPVLDVNGKRHALRMGITVIGRGHDANITVEDNGISRRHLQILWDGTRAQAKDLGSTNGSQLNGQRFSTAVLEPDSVIQIGRTSIIFRVVPQSQDGRAPEGEPASAWAPPEPAPQAAPASADQVPPAIAQPSPSPVLNPEPAESAPRPTVTPAADPAPTPAPRAEPVPRPDPSLDSTASGNGRPDPHTFWRDL